MATTGLGLTLKVGDAQGGPYSTTIAEVKDFSPPGLTSTIIDVSHHGNTTGFEEVILSALKRIPEITFEINFLPNNATHDHLTGLMYIARNSLKKHWEVTIPTPTAGTRVWRFAGYISSFQPTDPVDGALTASITLKPTDYMDLS